MENIAKCFFAEVACPGDLKDPKDICEDLMKKWCTEEGRTGAWAYCIKNYAGHYPVFDDAGNFLGCRLAQTEEEKKKGKQDFLTKKCFTLLFMVSNF